MDWFVHASVVLLGVTVIQGHVSLLFPAARYPPLDFLDNTRTSEPCGVPKPEKAVYTNLSIGKTYDITWHLGYAHKGGFQIDLLDSAGKVVKVLTPNGFIGNDPSNETVQSYTLTLPKDLQECNDCVLRLQRKADEWNGYKFWSCADVNIVPSTDSITPCFGIANGQTCQCPTSKSGRHCQFVDECSLDTDCGSNNQGKCTDLKTMGHPKKVCFCNAPYFGKHCEKKFESKPEDSKQNCFNYKFNQQNLVVSPGSSGVDALKAQFPSKGLYNPQCYHTQTVEDDHFFYWRFVGGEVEMILDFPGTSWVAIGWRPDYLNGRCQEFPLKIMDDIKSRVVRETPQQSHTNHSGLHETEPKGEPHPTAGQSNNSSNGIPEPEPKPISEHVHKPKGEPHPTAGQSNNSSNGIPEPEPKPISEHVHKPKGEPEPQPEAPAVMHPMDCTDVVVGSAQGKLSRAADMYTRDRSTPLEDSIYKGQDDLTAVYGLEMDSRTIIMFRKTIKPTGQSDHELSGEMHMIWARGQNATEKQSVGHPDFYEADVLKYHGGNRGSFTTNFAFGASTGNNSIVDKDMESDLGNQPSIVQNRSSNSSAEHLPTGTNLAQTSDKKEKDSKKGNGSGANSTRSAKFDFMISCILFGLVFMVLSS